MARNDDSQRGPDTPSRVYKSSDVHKRRVDRKGRNKKGSQAPDQGRPASRTDAEAPGSGQGAAEDNPAVVITPQFGKRTEAQRKADERWFAAMRQSGEADAPQATAPARHDAATPASPDGDALPPEERSLEPDETRQMQPVDEDNRAGETAQDSPKPDPATSDAASAGKSEAAASETQPGEGGAEPATGDSAPDKPGAQPSAEEGRQAKVPAKRPLVHLPQKRSYRIVAVIVAVLLVVAIVAAIAFAWNRWYRYDDHADMQGTWYAVGSAVPVAIDESSIHLTDDVTYLYEINAHDKTIRYTFGPMEGRGRYWFSEDRQYLVITDGNDFDGTSTAFDDLIHSLSDMGDRVTGSGMKLPEGDGIIAFTRVPDAKALAREKAEAEKKAADEEAARKEAERKEAEEAAAWDGQYYEEEAPAEGQAEGAENNTEGESR